jgi:hypothetical protein
MSYVIPYEALQAIWISGDLNIRDKLTLVSTFPGFRKWFVDDLKIHHDNMVAYVRNPFYRAQYYTHNIIYVSKWPNEPPPVLPYGCAANVYIDKSDANALGEICSWLGLASPKQLFFYTFFRKDVGRILTDNMLLTCALHVEILSVSGNELISNASVSKLEMCRDIQIKKTRVTMKSLRLLPNLLHVDYVSCKHTYTDWDEFTDTDTVTWLTRMREHKMLLASLF